MDEGMPGGSVPPNEPYQPVPPSYPEQPYTQQSYPPSNYPQPNGYAQPPYPPAGAMPGDQGLSDTAAGALAYITIIPAIVFLVLAPYNTRPFVKFHAFQCLGLFVMGFCLGVIAVIPVLGWIVWLLGSLTLLVVWVMSLIKASQGSYLRLPVISEFAAQQSGYGIGLR